MSDDAGRSVPTPPRDAALAAWGPLAVAVVAFALFAALAPADGGALVAAGAELGAARPAWAVLAHVASWLPFGDVVWRLHVASAATGALAVWATARLVIAVRRGGEPSAGRDAAAAWGGIAAGALLATSLAFVREATAIGAGAPVVALIAVAAVLVERVAAGAGARAGIGLAVVCGVGLVTHGAFAWLGPVVAALYGVRLYRGARFPLAAPAIVAVVAAGLLAYLPARAAGGAPGLPGTLGAVVDFVGDDGGPPASATPAERARRHAEDVGDSLGPVAVIAALAGAAALWRRRRTAWVAAAVTSVAALGAIDAVWGSGGAGGAPLVWAAAVAAGVGVAALVRLAGPFATVAGAAVAAICVLPAAVMTLAG